MGMMSGSFEPLGLKAALHTELNLMLELIGWQTINLAIACMILNAHALAKDMYLHYIVLVFPLQLLSSRQY